MPATLKEIKGYAFFGSGNLSTVTFLGDTLEKIESHTFEDCRIIENLVIPANVKKGSFLYVGALKYKLVSAVNGNKANVSVAGVKDTKLTKATVPNSLTYSVGDKKFSFTVTSIDGSAFYKCTKLKTVTIGKNVTSIGSKAFYGDKKLTKITINSKKLKKVGKQAFKNTKSKLKIKVPKAKKKKYKKLLKKGGFKGKIS